MKKSVIAALIPLLGVTSAFAGPSISVSGVTGEQTAYLGEFGQDTYNVGGVRVDLGYDLGCGFSFNGRFDHLEGDIASVDIESEEVRLLMNYETELAAGFSVVSGIGYGFLQHEALDAEVMGEGILLNLGVSFASGDFFGGYGYTHAFTLNSEFESDGVTVDGENEDIGIIELTGGYNINEQLAAILKVETQVVGETIVEKDWTASLGLNCAF